MLREGTLLYVEHTMIFWIVIRELKQKLIHGYGERGPDEKEW